MLNHMLTSSNGSIFRVSGPLCGEFIRHRWISLTKASDAELWYFLWSAQISLHGCLQQTHFIGERGDAKSHDEDIKWKNFPRCWPLPFVWVIHQAPVNSAHKGKWRGALMFSMICTCINGYDNNRNARDLRRHHAHYDVTVMCPWMMAWNNQT